MLADVVRHALTVNRLVVIGGLALLALVVGVALVVFADGDEDRQRYAVKWESIEVSPDRWTITLQTSYPIVDFCVKEPDGIDISVDGSVATVAAWMSGPAPQEGSVCTLECGRVTQAVTLDSPLPESVKRFEPVAGAVEGCWMA